MPGTGNPAPLLDGRYRLGQWLGGGGMADVYRGVDVRLDRKVAVKVFRSGTDHAGRARFEEEARLLARLNHPGLVPVYDSSASGAEPYLVMQLIEGETLAEILDRRTLTAGHAIEIGRRLCEVLAHVHANGIVHRDVKPSNILVSADDRVYLADFGVSRLVEAVGRMTGSGIVMGTTTYMAPEQVRDADVSYPADVYSLALVLLECLTGEVEYPGVGVESAVARLARSPEIPDGPEILTSVLKAMTRFEPERRPTAEQCAAWLSGQPPAGLKGITTRGARQPSVTARWVLFAAAAGVVIMAVVWFLLPADSVPAPTLPPAHGQPGRERLPADLATLRKLVGR